MLDNTKFDRKRQNLAGLIQFDQLGGLSLLFSWDKSQNFNF